MKTQELTGKSGEKMKFESICENCRNKRKTWSDKLTEDGYIGCVIGYDDQSRIHDIKAETVATGWILLGLATNGQIITRGTTNCPYKNQAVVRSL